MLNSCIIYKGEVSIKVKDKSPVRAHNQGTYHLFNCINRIFSTAIHKDADLSRVLPGYMSIICGKVDADTLQKNPNYTSYASYSVLVDEAPIVNRSIDSDVLVYTSLITNSQLISSTQGSSETAYFLLLNGDKTEILAFSDFDLSELENVYKDPLGQADLTWKLQFTNPTKEGV